MMYSIGKTLCLLVIIFISNHFIYSQTNPANTRVRGINPNLNNVLPAEYIFINKKRKSRGYKYGLRGSIIIMPSFLGSAHNTEFRNNFTKGFGTDLILAMIFSKKEKSGNRTLLLSWLYPNIMFMSSFESFFRDNDVGNIVRTGFAFGLRWNIPLLLQRQWRLSYSTSMLPGFSYENITIQTTVPPSTTVIDFTTRQLHFHLHFFNGLRIYIRGGFSMELVIRLSYSADSKAPHVYIGPALGFGYSFL